MHWGEPFPTVGGKGPLCLSDGRLIMVRGARARLVAQESKDEGRTWTDLGTVATDPDLHADMGDGNVVAIPGGKLLCVYRHNHHQVPDFAIEVAMSADDGVTWKPHSVVMRSSPKGPGPSRGLWAPFLFVSRKGRVQCFFDDEATPNAKGYRGHQWISMKTLRTDGTWQGLVTAARSHADSKLSRAGMASVVELPSGEMLCAYEAVQTDGLSRGEIHLVRSWDGGQTWSWKTAQEERIVIPKHGHAFCPWLTRLPSGALVCLYANNEAQAHPAELGTPAHLLNLDIACTSSRDGGHTWKADPKPVYEGGHRSYMPSATTLTGPDRLFVTFIDFDKGERAMIGALR